MKTIMRKNKVTISVLGGIGIVLIAALFLAPATQARAETVKYNYTTQLTKLEYVPLPDVQGHVAFVFERRGVAIFENEVAAVTITGTGDSTKGVGSSMTMRMVPQLLLSLPGIRVSLPEKSFAPMRK